MFAVRIQSSAKVTLNIVYGQLYWKDTNKEKRSRERPIFVVLNTYYNKLLCWKIFVMKRLQRLARVTGPKTYFSFQRSSKSNKLTKQYLEIVQPFEFFPKILFLNLRVTILAQRREVNREKENARKWQKRSSEEQKQTKWNSEWGVNVINKFQSSIATLFWK